MINSEQIKETITAISTFYWQIDYEQFCQLLDFNPTHTYSQEKWQQFQQLGRAVNYFDVEFLTKLIKTKQPIKS